MSSTPASSPTAGRWIVDDSRIIVAVVGDLESGQSRKAIGCAYFPACGTNEELDANAALFAASKTMLETLRRTEKELELLANSGSIGWKVAEDALVDVRKAIRIATTIGAPR